MQLPCRSQTVQMCIGRRLGAILVERGYTSEDVVAKVLASQMRLAYIRLDRTPVDVGATRLIGAQMATTHQLIPIAATAQRLTVAMANPLDLIALDDIELATGLRVEPAVAAASDVMRAIARYYASA